MICQNMHRYKQRKALESGLEYVIITVEHSTQNPGQEVKLIAGNQNT